MILLTREEIKNPIFLKDFPFSIYSKLIEKALKFLKSLCSKYQANWDIIIEAMYLIHYYCYYRSPKEFFIYDLVTISFFISFSKLNKNMISLSTINNNKLDILKAEDNLNPDFGSFSFEAKGSSIENLVNMEIEIYTILNFDLNFLTAFQAVFLLLEKLNLGNNKEIIRKLYNLLIFDIVVSPILICYTSNYIAISVLYITCFLKGIIDENMIIKDFIEKYGLNQEFEIDILVHCLEDIEQVIINNSLYYL